MKITTAFFAGVVTLIGMSLIQRPIKHAYFFEAEFIGFKDLVKNTVSCPCEKPCTTKVCGCPCILCNELRIRAKK